MSFVVQPEYWLPHFLDYNDVSSYGFLSTYTEDTMLSQGTHTPEMFPSTPDIMMAQLPPLETLPYQWAPSYCYPPVTSLYPHNMATFEDYQVSQISL